MLGSGPACTPSSRRGDASRASRYALNAAESSALRASPRQIVLTQRALSCSKRARYIAGFSEVRTRLSMGASWPAAVRHGRHFDASSQFMRGRAWRRRGSRPSFRRRHLPVEPCQLLRPHAVVAGLVFDLGKAELRHDRWKVHAKTAAIALAQAVPPAHRV